MKTIRVWASYSGKIPTGPYENASPAFGAEINLEISGDENPMNVISLAQDELQDLCYSKFKAFEQRAIVERINKERQDFRWYKDDQGNPIPSVTSVIGYDSDFSIPPDELQQYASQSNLCHTQVEHFIKTGEWKDASELDGTWTDIVIVKKGSLHLEIFGWDFPGFLKKYPLKFMANGKHLVNLKHKYGGLPDFEATPDFAEVKGLEETAYVPTICDVKRTPDKVKNFMQMAAYAKCPGLEHIQQMMIVPLNNKTEQGFSKPIIETRIDKYFDMFMDKRKEFKKRYGI